MSLPPSQPPQPKKPLTEEQKKEIDEFMRAPLPPEIKTMVDNFEVGYIKSTRELWANIEQSTTTIAKIALAGAAKLEAENRELREKLAKYEAPKPPPSAPKPNRRQRRASQARLQQKNKA